MFRMNDLILETLREDDIPLLRPVLEGDGQTYDLEHIRVFLSGRDNLAFVAKQDGKVVGLIFGYRLTPLWPSKPVLFVYSVDVCAGCRNRGYGSRLFQYVVDYARENGYSSCFTDAYKSNLPACRVYEKAGCAGSEDVVEYTIEF